MPPRSGLLDHPNLSNHGVYAEALVTNTPATTWIRVGLFALSIFGARTAWATIGAQPDAAVDRRQ